MAKVGALALVGSGEYLPVMQKLETELLHSGISNGKPNRYLQIPTAAGQESADRLQFWENLGAEQARRIGAVQDFPHTKKYDRVVLDMLAPWECVQMAAEVLVPGGVFIAYVATTTQLSQTAEAIKNSGFFTEPESSETIVRGWHHEGLAVRPQHRMIGHTAFLIMARRLAPNTVAPARRRRPSKGAYGTNESEN